jgi:hypothetical protein
MASDILPADRVYCVQYRGPTPSLGGGWIDDTQRFATEQAALAHARRLLLMEGRAFARIVNTVVTLNL